MTTVNEHFAYLVGALLFAAAWVVCFLVGKRYRPQMLWGSLVSAPFALTSVLFIPQYWTPPSLLDFDKRFKVGIEDLSGRPLLVGSRRLLAKLS